MPTRILLLTDSAGGRAASLITERVDAGLRSELDELELFIEALDVNRFPEPEYQSVVADFLRAKYAARQPDALLAVGPASLAFLAERGATLFPGSPIVYADVTDAPVPAEGTPPSSTGVISRRNAVETLELALRLQPETRSVVVVTGTAPLDLGWNAWAREELEPYRDRLEVTYLAGLPLAQLLEALRQLPRDTIVLFLTLRRDGAGEHLIGRPGLLAELSAVSTAPIYGVYDTYLGDGIVGGRVESFAAIGNAAASLVLRVLRGEDAAAVPAVEATQYYAVDSRQLRRWNLDESRLPPETIVMFREPSLWAEYESEIFATLFIVALQTLLIVVLLLYIRKRRVERTLHETEDRYRNVVATQLDLICRYLPDTTLTFVNDAYCRYFGREREALVGQRFIDLIPEVQQSRVLEQVRSLVTEARTVSYVHQASKPDGTVRWQQWIDHPIVDARGRVLEIQGIGRDITELKAAETEALQRREQVTHLTRVAVLGELSGALAHELNQPMTAILTNAEAAERLLAQPQPDLVELRAILKDIVADDIRAGEVIRRLRSMLKPGTTTFEPLDVGALVAEVLLMVRIQLVERNVKVVERSTAALPPVQGDRVQLQQVLLNLFINAGEAMSSNAPTDRVVIAETAHEGGFVRVSVTDNGTGLAPHVIGRLFQPFVTTKPDGLGLGLSICRSIISVHGGRLSARNNADRGVTVEFTLPVA